MNSEKDRERGFKVPRGYFEDFEERVLARPEQEGMRGFRVPEGYFEDFDVSPGSVSREKPIIQIDRNRRNRILWLAAAASILLFFGIKYQYTEPAELQWSSLEPDEISLWVESDLAAMNYEDIAEVYQELDLEVPVPDETDLDEYLRQVDLDEILDEY